MENYQPGERVTVASLDENKKELTRLHGRVMKETENHAEVCLDNDQVVRVPLSMIQKNKQFLLQKDTPVTVDGKRGKILGYAYVVMLESDMGMEILNTNRVKVLNA